MALHSTITGRSVVSDVSLRNRDIERGILRAGCGLARCEAEYPSDRRKGRTEQRNKSTSPTETLSLISFQTFWGMRWFPPCVLFRFFCFDDPLNIHGERRKFDVCLGLIIVGSPRVHHANCQCVEKPSLSLYLYCKVLTIIYQYLFFCIFTKA